MSTYDKVLLHKLPHIHRYGMVQFITFRLHDALPLYMLRRVLEAECDNQDNSGETVVETIEKILDTGHGNLWLGNPEIADAVVNTLFHGHGKNYDLHAWVIMPNHVHVLICPYERDAVSKIVQCWKSNSAKRANLVLRRQGQFWQKDYFDRFMRDQAQYARTIGYIEQNPVNAGLCNAPQKWKWSSAAYPRL